MRYLSYTMPAGRGQPLPPRLRALRRCVGAADGGRWPGSGDELRLRFHPGRLPALATRCKRDLLVLVDGWSKCCRGRTKHAMIFPSPSAHGEPCYNPERGKAQVAASVSRGL